VGAGKRQNMSRTSLIPGPAQYSPKADVTFEYAPMMSFSRSERQHISELIDPDEPPGPGSHTVRRDPKVTDKPSAGLPKDIKMRHVPCIGPEGPGPGVLPSFLDKKGRSIGVHLHRPVVEMPGPTDTAGDIPHDTDLLTQHSSLLGKLG